MRLARGGGFAPAPSPQPLRGGAGRGGTGAGSSSANLRRTPSVLAAPAPRDLRAEAPGARAGRRARGRPGRAFALGRSPGEPHAAPELAAAAARLPGWPGAGPGPKPRSPATERRRRGAPRRLRARAAPGREQGAGGAGRPRERRAPRAAAATARAGARLPARLAGPALSAPERRCAAGPPASRTPQRQGHGGAAGSEPRPGAPETSEREPDNVAAAAA